MSKPTQPVALGVKIGFLLLAGGGVAWLFLGDWRYVVAGLLALLAGAVLGAPTKNPVGICGHHLVEGFKQTNNVCELPHGHQGMHRDSTGCSWGSIDKEGSL